MSIPFLERDIVNPSGEGAAEAFILRVTSSPFHPAFISSAAMRAAGRSEEHVTLSLLSAIELSGNHNREAGDFFPAGAELLPEMPDAATVSTCGSASYEGRGVAKAPDSPASAMAIEASNNDFDLFILIEFYMQYFPVADRDACMSPLMRLVAVMTLHKFQFSVRENVHFVNRP